jgi:metal-responsive CopG/Arc/MetJ family transcriptional regulator
MSEGYDSISLPKSFVKKIDEIISKAELRYSSRAEFIKEAVRKQFKEYGFDFDVSEEKKEKI